LSLLLLSWALSWLNADIYPHQNKWLLDPFSDYLNVNSNANTPTPFPAFFLLRITITTHTDTCIHTQIYILCIFALLSVSPTSICIHFVCSLIIET
jgi:hypothetical protein